MANPLHHSISSARKFAGDDDLYELFRPIHEWFDAPKSWLPDARQRAIRHHAEGIGEAIERFQPVKLPSGRLVPVRFIAEQHIIEDLGRIPTAADWLREMPLRPWMVNAAKRLSKEID